jgi:DNA-binding XRE family transcriptional regulator
VGGHNARAPTLRITPTPEAGWPIDAQPVGHEWGASKAQPTPTPSARGAPYTSLGRSPRIEPHPRPLHSAEGRSEGEAAATELPSSTQPQRHIAKRDKEFSLIKARSDADLTQEQVAQAMGTTQAVVARLESGRVRPSTRTLQRFASATHSRLRITFETSIGHAPFPN